MTNEQTELIVNLLKSNLKTLIDKADEELGNRKSVREVEWEYIGKDPFGCVAFLACPSKLKEEHPDKWRKSKGTAIALDDLREFIDTLSEAFQE